MILFWHKEIAVKTVGPSVRRFYGDYLLFLCFLCILLTFSMICEIPFFCLAYWLSKTSKKAFNIVNLAAQTSQSCSPRQSILQPHFDCFGVQDIQNDTPERLQKSLRNVFSASGNMIFLCSEECGKVSAAVPLWYYYSKSGRRNNLGFPRTSCCTDRPNGAKGRCERGG